MPSKLPADTPTELKAPLAAKTRHARRIDSRLNALWLLACLGDLPFFFYFAGIGWGIPALALASHGLVVSLIGILIYGTRWLKPHEKDWAKVLLSFSLILPIFGWLGSWGVYRFYRAPLQSGDFFEPERHPQDHFEEVWGASLPRIPKKERILKELDIIPLGDILTGPDPGLKRGAIEKLAALKTPEAIAMLLNHRSNPSPEVRFYVTSALTRVKKEFDEELDAAKKGMEKQDYKVSARIFTAKTYIYYAASRLLDETTAGVYLREAVFHLKVCIESPYASVEGYFLLVDTLIGMGEWEEALRVLARMERDGKGDGVEILKRRASLFYSMGHFGEMKGALAKLKGDEDKLSGDWKALVHWWEGA